MNVVTVRRLSDGALLQFGPDNGHYEPVVAPGSVRAVEPDYDGVLKEWQQAQPVQKDRASKKAALQSANTVAQLRDALVDLF